MRFISIRKKLLKFASRILIVTLTVTIFTAALLVIILAYRTFKGEGAHIEGSLIDKGTVLVTNNSIALRGMAGDNAFSSIQELVLSTVEGDRDIEYGIFMDYLRRPWVQEGALAHKRDDDLSVADDSISIWADTLSAVGYKKIRHNDTDILEFAAPVFVQGERLGTIRYGISTARMAQSISSLKWEFFREIIRYGMLLIIVSVFLVVYELREARKQAEGITKPIDELTNATNTISNGNYNIPVMTSTDDEVGVLAQGFEQMRETVKQYTENLEQMVEERTQHLNTSLKEQLVQANKLVTLGTLVAGVTHEINNPNNSILISAGTLEDICRDLIPVLDEYVRENGEFRVGGYSYHDLTGEMPEALQRIINNSRRIKQYVEDLKNFSKKDSGEIEETVHLNDLVKDSVEIIENEITKCTDTFEVHYAENVPVIKGQRQRLEQVIVNLVQNACQALPSRDKGIRISTAYQQEQKQVVITIRDEGIGMDPKTRENVCESFYTTKQDTGGTGLGLFVTLRIVKDHGGTLTFDSEEGHGTTAVVALPV